MTIDTNRYVFLIGAPRSGTNMLRDTLTSVPGIATWPCDEINYIWRHGNIRYPSDQLPPDLATPSVVRYIRRQFDNLAEHTSAKLILEKTCANSLRVPFLQEVAPNARFIFLVRDGLDVVGSARLRWTARLDIPYLMKKVRYVPPVDLPYYATRYLLNRLGKLVSAEDRLAVWGPVTDKMSEWQDCYSLLQICALQWKVCVEEADAALAEIDHERVYRLSYESFVTSPEDELRELCRFLEVDASGDVFDAAVQGIRPSSVGRGRSQLDSNDFASVLPLIESTLQHYGYAS